MRLSGDLFWGLLFIVIGIVMVVKYAFHINLPVMRIIFGFILIYLGVSVLLKGSFNWHHDDNDVIFRNDNIKVTDANDEYNIIFGSSIVDLSDIQSTNENKKIEVNAIFSSGVLKIRGDAPIVIKANSGFASAHFPNGTSISFGDYTYKTKGYRENEPYILIEANVVFGQLNIDEF